MKLGKSVIFNNDRLRGKIYEKYKNVSAFSKDVDVDRAIVTQALNNKRSLRREDIVLICDKLEIPKEEIGYYFFDF